MPTFALFINDQLVRIKNVDDALADLLRDNPTFEEVTE